MRTFCIIFMGLLLALGPTVLIALAVVAFAGTGPLTALVVSVIGCIVLTMLWAVYGQMLDDMLPEFRNRQPKGNRP